MAWHRPGDKPLSEPMMLIYQRIYGSPGLNELMSYWTQKGHMGHPQTMLLE